MNRIKMKEIIKTFGVFLVVAVVACGLVLPQLASAAPNPPKWMPGFPMLAGNQLILMWNVVPGAVKYKVYLGADVVAEGPAIQQILLAPTLPGEFSYTVTAVTADGSESPKSNVKLISIIKLEPPTEITHLIMGNAVSLRWKSSAGAVIYDVHRKMKDKGDFQLITSTQDTRYKDSTLEKNVAYEFAIVAKDSSGKASDYSSAVEIMIEEVGVGDGGDQFAGYELHPQPLKLIGQARFPYFTKGIDIQDGAGILTAVRLYINDDVTDPSRWNPLFQNGTEASAPYKDLAFRDAKWLDEETVIAVTASEVFWIDPFRQEVQNRLKLPLPEEGELVFKNSKDKEVEKRQQIITQGVDVMSTGNIVITDNVNFRLIEVSAEGEYLGTFGKSENDEVETLPDWLVPLANFLKVAPDGRVFANSAFSVHIFSPEGLFEHKFGQQGDTVGSFGLASGHAFDSKGRLWIADIKNGTIQVFEEKPENPEDRRWEPVLVATNETKDGNPVGISKPAGMAFGPPGPSGTLLYIVDNINKALVWYDVLPQ